MQLAGRVFGVAGADVLFLAIQPHAAPDVAADADMDRHAVAMGVREPVVEGVHEAAVKAELDEDLIERACLCQQYPMPFSKAASGISYELKYE